MQTGTKSEINDQAYFISEKKFKVSTIFLEIFYNLDKRACVEANF
jgi:hypothetical protein